MEDTRTNDRIEMLIDAERARQDVKWGGKAHDLKHTPQEWRDMLAFYTHEAIATLDTIEDSHGEHAIIVVSALGYAVADMLEHAHENWSLDDRMAQAADWGHKHFPNVPAEFVAKRMADEVEELRHEVVGNDASRMEAADVAILLAIYAMRAGFDLSVAVADKMAINAGRSWDSVTMKHLKETGEVG